MTSTVDLRSLEHKCMMARAALKPIGSMKFGQYEVGDAIQNANMNLDKFKDAVAKQARELKAAREESTAKQQRLKELKAELAELKERKTKLQGDVDKEKREKKVSEAERTLQRKRDALRERVDALDKKLEAAAALLQSNPSSSGKSLEETTRMIELFTHRLGLRTFKASGGRLRICMKFIDAKEPEREFSFRISTNDEEYEVDEVQPPIRGLAEMVKELNETQDFSYFCRTMRRRFKETCQ